MRERRQLGLWHGSLASVVVDLRWVPCQVCHELPSPFPRHPSLSLSLLELQRMVDLVGLWWPAWLWRAGRGSSGAAEFGAPSGESGGW